MPKITLLIFDWFGEDDIGIYLIPDAPDWLKACHRQFLNGTDDEEAVKRISTVMDAIQVNPEYQDDPDGELAGQWVKHLQPLNSTTLNEPTADVVVTGFIP